MNARRVLMRLGSPRIAAGVMFASIALLLLAVIIPQSGYLGAAFADFVRDYPAIARVIVALGLDKIFGGWIIGVLAAVLLVNVLACTIVRFLVRRAGVQPLRRVKASRAYDADDPTVLIDDTERLLQERGWRTVRIADGEVVAEKGSSGFWGSVVLHFSLIVIMAGGIVSGMTAFAGEMVIADGQALRDAPEAYLSVQKRPEWGAAFTGATIALDATRVRYENGVLTQAVATMRGVDPSGRVVSKEVRVNHPLDVAGKSYLLMSSGLAAEVIVAEAGAPAENVIVNLKDKTPSGWSDRIEFRSSESSVVVLDLTVSPVPLDAGESLPVEALDVQDPRLVVRVVGDGGAQGGRLLASGEGMEVSPGLTLTFVDARLWNRYIVRGDTGRWVSYLGFWLAVIGAGWRFAVPHRVLTVWARPERGDVAIAYRARPWPGFDVSRDEALVAEMAGGSSEI